MNTDLNVHVEKEKIKGSERVTEGKSYKKTLVSAGVPKSVQKKCKKDGRF